MARKQTKKKSRVIRKGKESLGDVLNDDSRLFAFIATFFSVIGFVIALVARKNDRYVMYYAKHSLVIFAIYLIAAIAVGIPVFGWIVGPIIYVIAVVFWIISWVYALSGEYRVIPYITQYAKKIRF